MVSSSRLQCELTTRAAAMANCTLASIYRSELLKLVPGTGLSATRTEPCSRTRLTSFRRQRRKLDLQPAVPLLQGSLHGLAGVLYELLEGAGLVAVPAL